MTLSEHLSENKPLTESEVFQMSAWDLYLKIGELNLPVGITKSENFARLMDFVQTGRRVNEKDLKSLPDIDLEKQCVMLSLPASKNRVENEQTLKGHLKSLSKLQVIIPTPGRKERHSLPNINTHEDLSSSSESEHVQSPNSPVFKKERRGRRPSKPVTPNVAKSFAPAIETPTPRKQLQVVLSKKSPDFVVQSSPEKSPRKSTMSITLPSRKRASSFVPQPNAKRYKMAGLLIKKSPKLPKVQADDDLTPNDPSSPIVVHTGLESNAEVKKHIPLVSHLNFGASHQFEPLKFNIDLNNDNDDDLDAFINAGKPSIFTNIENSKQKQKETEPSEQSEEPSSIIEEQYAVEAADVSMEDISLNVEEAKSAENEPEAAEEIAETEQAHEETKVEPVEAKVEEQAVAEETIEAKETIEKVTITKEIETVVDFVEPEVENPVKSIPSSPILTTTPMDEAVNLKEPNENDPALMLSSDFQFDVPTIEPVKQNEDQQGSQANCNNQ